MGDAITPGLRTFPDSELPALAEMYRNRLAEVEAEQKRREAERAKTYGQREVERFFRGMDGNYMDVFFGEYGFGVELHIDTAVARSRYDMIRKHAAQLIDAARADMREQAAEAVETMPCHTTMSGRAVLVNSAAALIRELK